ncbi:hypothetical protein BDW02DRAFT_222262 [Decorospora gaudefroyi]|uniref:Uncharacterized protein n=1 Tax=Decorospora gaudefroyi TaxID=184978 RepID=A0A6A5KKK9_9PLEO|nr:hypothetical protein BDW02DRAFT_222262 [Decorospora gaudefroyi]
MEGASGSVDSQRARMHRWTATRDQANAAVVSVSLVQTRRTFGVQGHAETSTASGRVLDRPGRNPPTSPLMCDSSKANAPRTLRRQTNHIVDCLPLPALPRILSRCPAHNAFLALLSHLRDWLLTDFRMRFLQLS